MPQLAFTPIVPTRAAQRGQRQRHPKRELLPLRPTGLVRLSVRLSPETVEQLRKEAKHAETRSE